MNSDPDPVPKDERIKEIKSGRGRDTQGVSIGSIKINTKQRPLFPEAVPVSREGGVPPLKICSSRLELHQ